MTLGWTKGMLNVICHMLIPCDYKELSLIMERCSIKYSQVEGEKLKVTCIGKDEVTCNKLKNQQKMIFIDRTFYKWKYKYQLIIRL